MKKIVKKVNSLFICAVIIFSSTSTFAANIIYSPTIQETASTSLPQGSAEVVSPSANVYNSQVTTDAQVIADVYTAISVDYDHILDIIEDGNNFYCIDPNGTMVRSGWRKIGKASFAHYAPVEDFPYNYIWAYFTTSGRAVKATGGNMKRYKIGNYTYAFNEYGQLLTGFFNESGEMWNSLHDNSPLDLLDGDSGNLYYADENYGNLKSGWMRIDNTKEEIYPNKTFLWLYFNPSNFRLVRSTGNNYKSVNIDGLTYAFDDLGIMLTGLEAYYYNESHGGNTSKMVYFAEDGHEIKNGFVNIDYESSEDTWSEIYDDEDYEDEDITVYLSRTGAMYRNTIKKIGSSYYGFDENGVLVKGLSVWNNGNYIGTVSLDETSGKDFISMGIYHDKRNGTSTLSADDTIHYFDSNGKRRTNATLHFDDESYTYEASSNGGYNQVANKKCYSHGLLLKPPSGIRYGVYVSNPTQNSYNMEELVNADATVVGSNGQAVSSTGNAMRDEDDNYWLVSGSKLLNVYEVSVRKSGGSYQFRGTGNNGNETWVDFGEKDANGKTCVLQVTPNGTRLSNGAITAYQTRISSDSALNFKISR